MFVDSEVLRLEVACVFYSLSDYELKYYKREANASSGFTR